MVTEERHEKYKQLDAKPPKMPDAKEKKSKRERSEKSLARSVDKYTKRGTAEIQDGHLQKALENFERAFVHAQRLGAGYPIRACAFNLGAVYIASRESEKGVEMLMLAIPPHQQSDGKSNGDLYFNFALGYDTLNNPNETSKYLELALEEYQSEKTNHKMEGSVAKRLGELYMSLGEWLSGARANGLAARAFSLLEDHENQAVATSQEATCLFQGNRHDLALQIADDCMVVCQGVPQGAQLGTIYNELGLTYSQCRDFGKAVTCFELALPLSRTHSGDRSQETVILQNLGAIYNSVGDFERAIGFHQEAARIYGELNKRNAQGKCFTNLAFAYSQIYNTEKAGEFYLHALQAAKDTGDSHGQWQALEGLGAVAFNEGQYQKAMQYFKLALSILSSSETNRPAQERIVAKLSDAIHYYASQDSNAAPAPLVTKQEEETLNRVDILVNDLPRPPTRQEMRQREILAIRRAEGRVLRKRNNEFDPVALGVSEYSTDDDTSLERKSLSRSRPRSRKDSRKVKRAASLSSSLKEKKKRHERDFSEVDGQPLVQKKMNRDDDGLTRRLSSVPRVNAEGRWRTRHSRNFHRSLLRANSDDSEGERYKFVNRPRYDSTSGTRNKDENEDDEPDEATKRDMYPDFERPSSRHVIRSTSLVESSLRQSLKKVVLQNQDTNQENKDRGSVSSTTYFSDHQSVTEDESIKSRRMVNKNVEGSQSLGNRSNSLENIVESGSNSSGETQLKRENGSEELLDALETDVSKLPPSPPIPVEQPSLNATYVTPVPSPSKRKDKENGKGSEEDEDESSDEETESEQEKENESPEQRNYSLGNYMTSLRPNRTVSAPQNLAIPKQKHLDDFDEDPTYQTIKSAKSTLTDRGDDRTKSTLSHRGDHRNDEPQPGTSQNLDEGPPLPPRPSFETMTRAEKEAFLDEYQRKRDETIKRREEEVEDLALPHEARKFSKACTVM